MWFRVRPETMKPSTLPNLGVKVPNNDKGLGFRVIYVIYKYILSQILADKAILNSGI